MKITRNGVEIELTREEMNEAHSIIEREYREEDALRQLFCFVFSDGEEAMKAIKEGIPPSPEMSKELSRFRQKYKIGFLSLVSPNSADYVIPKLVKSYEKHFDCETSENNTWEFVIEKYLEERK